MNFDESDLDEGDIELNNFTANRKEIVAHKVRIPHFLDKFDKLDEVFQREDLRNAASSNSVNSLAVIPEIKE
jgi:hypothetical protein